MKNKYKLIILFSIIISISNQNNFKLTSNDIKNNEYIPKEFTPYDKDINPQKEQKVLHLVLKIQMHLLVYFIIGF